MKDNTSTQKFDLAGQIIGCAMEVHRELGSGFCESVYQKSLAIELQNKGFIVKLEKKIKVYYKGHIVGNFSADLFVNDCIIVELKAIRTLSAEHEVQLVNYLTATNTDEGLLINFGSKSLEFKKKYKDYKPSNLK